MIITIEITDEKQRAQFEALRKEKSAEEFAARCFEDGLKMAEHRERQSQLTAEAAKHPLLQFPEARAEFRELDAATLTSALKAKDPQDPIAVEITRLVSAYMGQVSEYARQNGNRLPTAMRIDMPKAIIEKAAFEIAARAIRAGVQKAGPPSGAAAAAA